MGFALVATLFVAVPGLAVSWSVQFEEVSREVGIEFRHAGEIHDPDGSSDWPAFPEIMGSGACWADFDGDGFEDLYVANQRFNEQNPYAQGYNDLFDPTNRFYVNDGNGSFVDRTGHAGLESRLFDHGCSAVDYDADGRVDLVVYGFGSLALYRNEGDGTFQDVTAVAGLDVSGACLPHDCWNTCAVWADFDGDGWLDLFVCTYVESHMQDSHRGPGNHVALLNFLFQNNGDGTFTEVAEDAGVAGIAADELGSKSLGAVWFDADLDGRPDLYVVNDMTPNEFYWNDGDGSFTRDDDAGLYDDRAGMGVASGYSTRSGYPDLYFTHYASQHNGYYKNGGNGTFADHSGEGGLANDWDFVGWGTHLVDLDRDGRADIVAVNGQTDWGHEVYGQATLAFWQEPLDDGGTQWTDVSSMSGRALEYEQVSRGAAFADYDLDGDVDMVIVNNANQSLQFLEGSGNTNNWLYVQPAQEGPNHEAVGARVSVEVGGVTQYRDIQAGAGYMSQNTRLADFGVGSASVVDRVTVQWPDGGKTTVTDLPAQRIVRVDRTTGAWSTDTLSPLTQAMLEGDGGTEGWFGSDVDVLLSADDRAVGPTSGVARTEYRIDQGPWLSYDGQTLHFSAVHGDERLIKYRSADEAGNEEPLRQSRLRFDLRAPGVEHEFVGVPGSDGWWVEAEMVLTASDEGGGVDEIRYRLNGGDWKVYEGPVALPDGLHQIEYQAVDLAGNGSPVEGAEVGVDATPPDVEFLRPQEGTLYHGGDPVAAWGGPAALIIGGDEFPVQVDSSDATSDVARIDLFLDGQNVATFHEPQQPQVWQWDLTGTATGLHELSAVAADRAGNVQYTQIELILVRPASGIDVPVQEWGLYPALRPWAGAWMDPAADTA